MIQTPFHRELFTDDEQSILLQFFTNVDKPVFGLINLPDVVKGALFARYSRSNKSLRRLFIDEFYTKGYDGNPQSENSDIGVKRATDLYDKMFFEYGDDSVAQLGGAHLACEQASNILVKVLERGRLAAYLEQSTRYVYYNKKVDGHYNYTIPEEIKGSSLLHEYTQYLDSLFDTYTLIADELQPFLKDKFPKTEGQSDRAWETTLKAKACDIVRGLLPASTKTNMGIFATGQAYESMLVRMFASNNAEVISYANMILEELRKTIPSFLKRVDLENRGKLWSRYFSEIKVGMQKYSLFNDSGLDLEMNSSQVELVEWEKDPLDKLVAWALYEYSEKSYQESLTHSKNLNYEEKTKIVSTYFGQRENRRHKPGRALETIFYRFDILSDYGAFRDLQRHRMLSIDWQYITPNHGYVVPDELNEFSKLKELFINVLERAKPIYEKLRLELGLEISQYVVPFAYKIRYVINLNLREAIHLIELRTQKQGHPSYRRVCQEMHSQIASKAGHNFLADAMKYVDLSEYDLGREDAEKKIDHKIVN